jgi:hypothetical protein
VDEALSKHASEELPSAKRQIIGTKQPILLDDQISDYQHDLIFSLDEMMDRFPEEEEEEEKLTLSKNYKELQLRRKRSGNYLHFIY